MMTVGSLPENESAENRRAQRTRNRAGPLDVSEAAGRERAPQTRKNSSHCTNVQTLSTNALYLLPLMWNPYEKLGGREATILLSERFYDLMSELEPDLARLHELDESGRVSRRSRDRFALFFMGWLGGPDDYVQQNGHPRLRMRHARVPVDIRMRDAWLRCMFQAMDDLGVDPELQAFLRPRLAEVANFLRNVVEEAPAAGPH